METRAKSLEINSYSRVGRQEFAACGRFPSADRNAIPAHAVETCMMTRRGAILVSLGFPLLAREFWNDEKPSDWRPDEIQQLLTSSPWAKSASINYYAGPGGAGRPVSGATAGGRRGHRAGGAAAGGTSTPDATVMSQQQYKAIVRWESALPIREATRGRSQDDPLANYIISVTGDLPMLGLHLEEDETERQQRAEMLKQYTKLERKKDPIYLAKVNFQSASGTLFYFPRLEPIYLDDKQVTFTTKLGPLEVKAKFLLKDMVYQGKLAL